MTNNTSGNRIDANLIPSNIKDGVTIFGVEGTLETWLINLNLKPVHYKWMSSVSPSVTNNTWWFEWATIMFDWNIWFFGTTSTTMDVNLWLIKLNLTTWEIHEYEAFNWNYNLDWTFRIDWSIVYHNWSQWINEYTSWRDLENSTSRTNDSRTSLWVAMTNSELFEWNTFQSLYYWPPTNQDTHTNVWYSWFQIS